RAGHPRCPVRRLGRPGGLPAGRPGVRPDEACCGTGVPAPRPGGAMTLPAIRAVARIAWRQVRRNPWRSVLVGAMVALPITALAGTVTVMKTITPTAQQVVAETMGSADIVIQGFSNTLRSGALLHELPPGTRVVTGRALYSQNIVRG